jgi:hypothetical protein
MRGSIHWRWPSQYVFSLPLCLDVQCPHLSYYLQPVISWRLYGNDISLSFRSRATTLTYLAPTLVFFFVTLSTSQYVPSISN